MDDKPLSNTALAIGLGLFAAASLYWFTSARRMEKAKNASARTVASPAARQAARGLAEREAGREVPLSFSSLRDEGLTPSEQARENAINLRLAGLL